MKRKLFFLLDRLQISRSERISITVLMVLAVTLTITLQVSEPSANYSEEYYAELERVFAERSRVIESEKEQIMQRYRPITTEEQLPVVAAADTLIEENPDVSGSALVNINTANAETLQKLPGIGPAYAERIIEWREKNGEFKSKDQLLEVRGIGPARLSNIRPLIILE